MPSSTPKPTFAKKRDIIIIAVVLLAAVLLYLAWQAWAKPGGVAQITVVTPGQTQQQVYLLPLNQDTLYTVPGTEFAVTIQVQQGQVRFVNSQCPDHLCENFGWLNKEGEEAVCLPAGVWLRVIPA